MPQEETLWYSSANSWRLQTFTKVCHRTADKLQPHTRILMQLVRQRQSLQKKAASQKKDPAYQREKSLGYLKTVKRLFVFQWHFQAPSSHKPLFKRCSCPSCGCTVKIRKKIHKSSRLDRVEKPNLFIARSVKPKRRADKLEI
ncbi:hypothetical protein PoB_005733600 [Plakobranchus ocellatus]|uniref:60S ribosomal protein L34 n=1 Tax=Plakobranchus ocellatus TaxID=259542 RepID=A0AAV4CDK7_9GAST|nr:hypothetical protein PoB_005733600 [Plakobranchus ocellatus]